MNILENLSRLFAEIEKEVRQNPDFAERIARAFDRTDRDQADSLRRGPGAPRGSSESESPRPSQHERPHRRSPGVLDPFEIIQQGEDALKARLDALDVEELKDIVAEHGMDRARLAMKWKTKDRLVSLITETVASRARKGEAFREPPKST